MKKIFQLLSLSLMTVSLFSCSNKLTREKAQELILQEIKLPEDLYQYFDVDKEFTKVSGEIQLYNNNFNSEDRYQQSGLIQKYEYPGWIGYSQRFTEEGKKYLSTNIITPTGGGTFLNDYRAWTRNNSFGYNGQIVGVKVAKIKFGEITGLLENIQGNKTITQVDYTLILSDFTPFGQLINLNENATLKHSAYFAKYDDGWRVSKIQ